VDRTGDDGTRRQLRDATSEHVAGIGPWRDLLLRLFDPATGAAPETKAALLGLSTRRRFIQVGGATLLTASVLGACSDSERRPSEAGRRPPGVRSTTTTSTIEPTSPQERDLMFLRTGTSLELLAVDVYQQALDSGALTTPAVQSAVEMFLHHHRDHAAALQFATSEHGGTPYTEPNPVVMRSVVVPVLPTLTDEPAITDFARSLEMVAASTYAHAAGELSNPIDRRTMMSLGGAEARHAAVFAHLVGTSPTATTPEPFINTDVLGDDVAGRIPDAAHVPA
jgi:hypothetical protein